MDIWRGASRAKALVCQMVRGQASALLAQIMLSRNLKPTKRESIGSLRMIRYT
jgi:hypothetical protein